MKTPNKYKKIPKKIIVNVGINDRNPKVVYWPPKTLQQWQIKLRLNEKYPFPYLYLTQINYSDKLTTMEKTNLVAISKTMFYLETQQTQSHVSNLNSVTIQELLNQTIQRAIRNFSHKLKQSTNSNKLSSKFPKPQSNNTHKYPSSDSAQPRKRKNSGVPPKTSSSSFHGDHKQNSVQKLMEVTRYHIKSTERYLNRLLPWSSFFNISLAC